MIEFSQARNKSKLVPLEPQRVDPVITDRDHDHFRRFDGFSGRLTVDHGVVVGSDGDHPVETAISGLTRVENHSKYGFGELRVKPTTLYETNVKKQIEKRESEH